MNITEPLEGETKYSPRYIYRQIFGTLMRGHHQNWPDIHLDELRLINPDTAGWIRMEGSPINYPVVSGRGNRPYYLTHNFSGEESYHGAVAIRGTGVLGERTTVISAHHMKDGSMFFALTKLFYPEYHKSHKGLELLLSDGLYRAEFFAVHFIDSRDPEPTRTEFLNDEDYGSWLARRKKLSLYDIPLTPAVNDRVLVLTTCVFPDDPDDRHDEIAVYAVIRKAEDRAALPKHIEIQADPPMLVNLWHPLPEDYVPELLPIEGGCEIDRICQPYLLAMLADCLAAGGEPFVVSAYRSTQLQRELFESRVDLLVQMQNMDRRLARGIIAWRTAPPGTSEHELGLAADITCEDEKAADFTVRWLSRNAWRYGFILRYPEGREDITGILYEPWHFRFVGTEHAQEIQRPGITLEEYTILISNKNETEEAL